MTSQERKDQGLTDEERARRRAAVDYAERSMRLEGYVADADIRALNERYVSGEMTSEELTAAIKAAVS